MDHATPCLLALATAAPLLLPACTAGSSTAPPGTEPSAATAACPKNDGGVTELGKFGDLDGQFAPIAAIAADADGVYVVVEPQDFRTAMNTTTVVRVPACGGPTTVLTSRTSPAMTGGTFAALAASHRVFVVMGDGIYSVPTAGGAMATETTSTKVVSAPITAYGDQLYWIEGATLWAVKTGGGNPARAVATSSVPMTWTSLATDGLKAYVTASPLPADGGAPPTATDQASGSVLSVSLSSGAISTLASGLYNPGNIFVAGSKLYWTSDKYLPSVDTANGTGSIETVTVGGGPLVDVVQNETPPPGSLIVLGTTIYWIDPGGPDGWDTLRMLPAGGKPLNVPTPLLVGLDGFILANTGAYWYSSSDYTFGRIAL